MLRYGDRSQGVQFEAIGVFPQLLGNSQPQGMIHAEYDHCVGLI